MNDSKQLCVAMVDDNASLCRAVGRLLRGAGIQSVSYGSAEAFLSDGNRPCFDCLILDIELGGMSGIELNERLKASGSTIPVIFNTAHDELETFEEAALTGCAAYLQKSDSGETVLAALWHVIRSSPGGQPNAPFLQVVPN
jgi:FixJ family two-component response regulator